MANLQFILLAILLVSCESPAETVQNKLNGTERFEFTRIEPGNELGITTKVIAHIHRRAKTLTETWRLNREFTPAGIVEKLMSVCSDELIESELKWSNCELDMDGLTAELTFGVAEPKNKTLSYIEMYYKPFRRTNQQGKQHVCRLSIVEENPVYFLMETFSKLPSNDSFPRSVPDSVNTVHQHRLGKFGPEFLSIYGPSIDKDGIYNFDAYDHMKREQLYECFLSIGSSESTSVIQEKCPITCFKEADLTEYTKLDNDHPDLDTTEGIQHLHHHEL